LVKLDNAKKDQPKPIAIDPNKARDMFNNLKQIYEHGTNEQKRTLFKTYIRRMEFDPESNQVHVVFYALMFKKSCVKVSIHKHTLLTTAVIPSTLYFIRISEVVCGQDLRQNILGGRMFKRDYIMKMIEQFSNVLAKVIGLKSANKIEETQQVLNEALHHFTGLSEATIESLSYKDLINLVSGVKEVNTEKCFILAELLKEKADVYASLDDMDKSFNLYLKSFNIYVEVMLSNNSSHLEPNHSTIDQIINIIKQFQIPYGTQKLLFHYYERILKYDKAEDVLFDLLDQGTRENIMLSEGAAFYERLSKKGPEELEKGNLPIDEVLEGMEKIQNFKG
jgi:hypothetical protein